MATILVVEDHAGTRKPLARLLQLEGFKVLAAATAFEALAATQHSEVHLILLDVMIPPMDGLTFLMRLREDPRGREIPVVIVTGLSDSQTTQRAKELGVRDHLVKSQFTPEELMETVKRYVQPDPALAAKASHAPAKTPGEAEQK